MNYAVFTHVLTGGGGGGGGVRETSFVACNRRVTKMFCTCRPFEVTAICRIFFIIKKFIEYNYNTIWC